MRRILILFLLFMLFVSGIEALELKKVLEIGSEDQENYIFFQIGPIAVDKNGNIYAAEGETKVIRKYDKTGKFVKKIGSNGQGPLEFMMISSMIIQNDHLLVYDSGNKRLSLYDLDLNLVRQGNLSGISHNIAANGEYYIANKKVGPMYHVVFRKPFAACEEGKTHELKPLIPDKYMSSFRAMIFFANLFAVHPISQQAVATNWYPPRGELQLTFFDASGNLLRQINSEAIVPGYRIDENRLDRTTSAKVDSMSVMINGIDWLDAKTLIVQYVYGRGERENNDEMAKIDAHSGRILNRMNLTNNFIMKCVRGGYVYGHILDDEDAEIKIGVYKIE